MEKVIARIEYWKRRLLDLSRRNRLVYFQPGRSSTLQVIEPGMEPVFRRLVVDESPWRFWEPPVPDREDGEPPAVKGNQTFLFEAGPKPRSDELVCAGKDSISVRNTLRNLLRRSRTDFEERGLRILHLAVGMLEWRETEGGTTVRSPLILVPVEMRRESARDPFVLAPCDEDVLLNPALRAKLENEFHLNLPPLPDDWEQVEVADYFEQVQEDVEPLGWMVSPEVWLGLFSFHKLAMYQDLSANTDALTKHPIIRALGGDRLEPEVIGDDLPPERELDRRVNPRESFLIADADSSQLACIEAVKRGTSVVVHGPPGSGKSQTIMNIIAEAIAAGRTVLFVSEKMAALDVVHKRLKERGLGHLTLELHSHKANKRDVVAELDRCLRGRVDPPVGLTELEFEQLAERRRHLNDYVAALHDVRHPLGQTAYQVLGQLAQLKDVPLVAFRFDGAKGLTAAGLARLLQLASRMAQVWTVAIEGESFPWRGCRETVFSNQVRSVFERSLSEACAAIRDLQSLATDYASRLGLDPCGSLADCRWLVELAKILAEGPGIDPTWLTAAEIDPLIRQAAEYSRRCDEHRRRRLALEERYQPEFFDLQPQLADDISRLASQVGACLGVPALDDQGFFAARQAVSLWARDSQTRISDWMSAGATISSGLGLPVQPSTLRRLRDLVRLVDLATAGDHPEPDWLEPRGWQRVHSAAARLEEDYRKHNALRSRLDERYFADRLLRLDLDMLVEAFNGRYRGPLRYLKPGFYRARATIARCTRTGSLPAQFLEDLVVAREWKELRQRLEREFDSSKGLLGRHFAGFETDFAAVGRALDVASEAMQRAGADVLPDRLKAVLAGERVVSADVRSTRERLGENLSTWEEATKRLAPQLPLKNLPKRGLSLEDADLTTIQTWFEELATLTEQLNDCADRVVRAARTEPADSVATLVADLRQLGAIRSLEEEMAREGDRLQSAFGARFAGVNTPWVDVLSGLEWSARVRNHFGKRALPGEFVEKASAGGQGLPQPVELERALAKVETYLADLAAKFESGWPRHVRGELSAASLADLHSTFDRMLGRLDGLRDWIDYNALRREFANAGLQELLTELDKQPPPPAHLPDVVRKAVLQAWVDWMFAEDARLGRFRASEHERLIQEFRSLDAKHWQLGAYRVIEEANKRRPDGTAFYNAGEIQTLLSEAKKKRRHLPIRKLFERIPNLLQRLKPVLLMSPISVSQFLHPERLRFDLVVFDEASQICSEDAVGAIYRCDQLVVCGDNRQLPPTAFFQLGMSDDEYYDVDEAEGEALAEYDSILDECAALGMRESPLRWHYRSRHESLIAFSNKQFYGSDLITFPSYLQHHDELGIKFEYVADGVYDRGGRRDNQREAERVVELVIEHFQRWPTKSLGVIAFSQPQMEAIENTLEARLRQQPDLERYLGRDRLDGFFVKNLENVQGDERDVIIFSVGYARDRSGRMTMNFGPLNAAGGERRLNVAVTRAREKIILVSSIRAADIDLNAAREGVRQLRKYLDYAERGLVALEYEDTYGGEPESPLEISVAEAIREMGFDVVPQVGCSRFRVDIGVVDPAEPGRFLLGVECDGRTYHSSATARDRDRLRQQVLERLGWRIHRIWSPDWVHRRTSEVERLRAAIQRALEARDAGRVTRSEDLEQGAEQSSGVPFLPSPSIPAVIETADLRSRVREWLKPYRRARLSLRHEVGPDFHLPEYRQEQVRLLGEVVAAEGPVHIGLATRRLLEAWGLQRAGARIRAAMREAARRCQREGRCLLKGDFLWPTGLVEVSHVRVPTPGDPDTERSAEHIPSEEYALAMRSIVRETVGISADALITEVARIFGFARIGPNIHERLRAALDSLIRAGVLISRGGQITEAGGV